MFLEIMNSWNRPAWIVYFTDRNQQKLSKVKIIHQNGKMHFLSKLEVQCTSNRVKIGFRSYFEPGLQNPHLRQVAKRYPKFWISMARFKWESLRKKQFHEAKLRSSHLESASFFNDVILSIVTTNFEKWWQIRLRAHCQNFMSKYSLFQKLLKYVFHWEV